MLHTEQPELAALVIVLGSERGFCGDYNVLLSWEVAQLPEKTPLVILGQKLAPRLDNDPRADFVGPQRAAEKAFESMSVRKSRNDCYRGLECGR